MKRILNLLIVSGLALGLTANAIASEGEKNEKISAVKAAKPKLAPNIEFVRRLSGFGKGVGQFQYPSNVGTDANGNVYVSDTGNHRIQVFNRDGQFLKSFGSYGRDPGEFSFPADVKVDANGNIYVADMANHRIQVLDENGNFIRQIGSMGKVPGYLQCPYGIDIDDEYLYIADTMAHRIQKFTLDGTFVTAWGEFGENPGQFHFPRDVAVSPDGEIYVADAVNNRIQVFTSNGQSLRTFGSQGMSTNLAELNVSAAQDPFACPDAIAFAPDGSFYVADMVNHRVKVYDASEDFVGSIGGYGMNEGQFALVKGVAVSNNGEIWVTHTGYHTLDKFVNTELQQTQRYRRR